MTDGLLRLSVGIEGTRDLIDLRNALDATLDLAGVRGGGDKMRELR
jgi:hypothetical protein